jgi:hypothetical protein
MLVISQVLPSRQSLSKIPRLSIVIASQIADTSHIDPLSPVTGQNVFFGAFFQRFPQVSKRLCFAAAARYQEYAKGCPTIP